MGIDAAFGIELPGAALLGNYAVFQDHDLVGTGHLEGAGKDALRESL